MSYPLAVAADVAALYGVIPDADSARVDALLQVASNIARVKAPSLDERLAAGTLDATTVATTVASAVVRALRNPGGVKSQTTGPFSVTYDDRAAAGFVYFTDDELLVLGASPAGTGRRFGTIRVRAGW